MHEYELIKNDKNKIADLKEFENLKNKLSIFWGKYFEKLTIPL